MVKKLNLFLFIGFLLLLSSISFSVTRYVNNTDADATACGVAGNINYSTIQAAVLAMDAYDTIIVCYSTTPYGANLNITKPGTFTGVGSLVPVYFNTTTTTQSYIFRLISGNVNVSGFYFMNSTNSISTTAGPYGVAVSIVNSSISVNISNNKFENLTSAIELYENSSNVYFENNTVINSSGVVPVRLYFSSTPISNLSIFNNTIFGNNTNATHCSGAPCYGVYLNNVNSTSIKGNIFTNGSYAVYIFNSRGATSAGQVKILDNIVSKSLTGFYVGNSTQVNISRNSISSLDTISTEGGYGMYISTSNYTFISANNISNTAQDAFKLFNISNSSIIDNRAIFAGIYWLTGQGFFFGYVTGDSDPINFVDNNVSNNFAANATVSGFYFHKSLNNWIQNNTAINNTRDGMEFFNCSNNTIINNSAYLNKESGISVYNSSTTNLIVNNSLYNNTLYGIKIIDSDSQNISFNKIFTNFHSGIIITTNDNSLGNHKIYSNEIYGHTLAASCTPYCPSGIYSALSIAPIHIFNNLVIENNTVGIFGRESNYINITGNVITNSNSSDFGAIYLTACISSTISQNNISNSTYSHIFLGSGTDNNISNNNLTNVSSNGVGIIVTSSSENATISGGFIKNLLTTATNTHGIYIYSQSNATIRNLVMLGASATGSIGIKVGSFANISNVNLSYFLTGLQINSSTARLNMSNVSIYNASMGLQTLFNASVLFLGNNFIYNTTSNGLDINVTNGSIITTNYNLTTNFNSYELISARDVEIKSVNLSDLGLSAPIYSLIGPSVSRAKILDYSGILAAVNVTNQSSYSSISVKMYFNSSSYPGYPILSLGRYSGSQWSDVGVLSSGASYLSFENYSTAFNYFAPIAYELSSVASSTPSSSGNSISKSQVSLGNNFDSSTGILRITVSESSGSVSGVSVRLYDTRDYSFTTAVTDGSGIAQFQIIRDGTYQAEIPAGSSYLSTPILITIELGEEIISVEDTIAVTGSFTGSFNPVTNLLTITSAIGSVSLSAVSVRLYDTRDYSFKTAVTDSSGIAQFQIIRNGTYQAEIPTGSDYPFTPILITISLGEKIISVEDTTAVTGSFTGSFNPVTNVLSITSVIDPVPISDVSVRLYDTSDYSFKTAITDSSGTAKFTITKDGVYQAEIPSASGYVFTPVLITVILGEEEIEVENAPSMISEPESGSSGGQSSTPTISSGGSTDQPSIKENESIVVQPKTEKEQALEKIIEADKEITIASKENKDVSDAKSKLSEANIFLSKGQYTEAETLAITAASLAKNAKPLNLKTSESGTTGILSSEIIPGFTALHLIVVLVVISGLWFIYDKMVLKRKPKFIRKE